MNVSLRRAAEYAFKIHRPGEMAAPNGPVVEGIFGMLPLEYTELTF